MTLTVTRVLADAGALWRRDRDLLVRVAAPFLFLPEYAMKLLVPQPVPVEGAVVPFADALQVQAQFISDHLLAYLLEAAAVQFGLAALFALYTKGDVRGALRRGALLWPRLMLAGVLVGLPGTMGLVLIVPGLIVFGRAILTGPLLAGEPRISAMGAVLRSVRLTRGSTLAVAGLAAVSLLLRAAEMPFDQLDLWLRGLHAPNPVARAVIDAAGAGASALAQVAACLLAVAAYRGLASRGI